MLFSKLCFDSAKADVITGEQIRLRNALEATESGLFDFFLCPFDFFSLPAIQRLNDLPVTTPSALPSWALAGYCPDQVL